MRRPIPALAAMALLAPFALGQTKTYEVKEGDTLSSIAVRHQVTQKDLIQANQLPSPDRLRLGQKLVIPSAARASNPTISGATHTVRNGDFDWSLARRYQVSVQDLAAANPGVSFAAMPVGAKIQLPPNAVTPQSAVPSKKAEPKPAAKSSAKTVAYKVKKNDNDWVLAQRFGTTAAQIRALNPGTNWAALQIGATIQVPATAQGTQPQAQLAVNRIATKHAKIAKNGTAVRRQPSVNAAKITEVDRGVQTTVLDRKGDWYQLRFPRGTVGWVRGDLLEPVKATQVAQNTSRAAATPQASRNTRNSPTTVAANLPKAGGSLLDTAMSFKGVRYVYGGTSRSGMDCSGFVQTVFKNHGISLPRTASTQAGVGQSVGKGNLKPGDVVFFQTGRAGRINHSGIYIGGGQFIHASSSGKKVQINRLDEGYYSRQFRGGKRMANVDVTKPKAEAKPAEKKPAEKVKEESAETQATPPPTVGVG